MGLSEAQELVGSFAEMIVDLDDSSVLWPAMLQRLQQSIAFDAGYIAATWGTAAAGRGAVAEHDPLFLRKNLDRFLAEFYPHEVALYTDQARVHHDVWPQSRQAQLAVFRELLHPTGVKHMIVRVGVRDGNVAGVNLERRDATPYTERDLRLVDVVAPLLHIAEVMTLREQGDCISAEFTYEYQLTRRESELVALTARGLQNSEIALLMGVSVNTVRNTLARIFEKVGVSKRAELAYVATRSSIQGAASRSNESSRKSADGLHVFRACVEKASTRHRVNARERKQSTSTTSIVYSPPLV